MTKIYHSTNELTDPQAVKIQLQNVRAIEALGGDIRASKSFFHGTAVLVLELPEGVDPSGLNIEGVSFKEYVEEGEQR
jgi:hypothetical protein